MSWLEHKQRAAARVSIPVAETNDLCPTAVVVLWPGFEPHSPSKPQLHSTPTRLQLPDVPWGIISIKAQDEDCETPMQVRRGGVGR